MSPVGLGLRVSTLRRVALAIPRARISLPMRSGYASSGLSRKAIETRVLDALKSHNKIDPAKLTVTSSFADLGLDSLDTVEAVMAVEEEFRIEIPDAEANEITTVEQAIDYIAKTPDAT